MTTPEQAPEGIAIIGMAGRFPGARNVAEFWRNLVEGRETISQLSDEQLAAAGFDPAELRADRSFVAARGLLERPEWFDAAFFGITPKEAEVTDPQQRVFLEEAWAALEDAGIDPARAAGSIGVFAGMSNNTYFAENVSAHPELIDAVGQLTAMMGNEKDYLATRVAYKLNLKGPALNIYTACSTSLVAVCQAVTALQNFQCDAALAGGISITFPQERGYQTQEGGITSPDGHCRAFDTQAAGTVFSSGVGIVVLKRLAEALADGDQIYAVIKGAALNNDGSGKVSFTAPSVDGHAEVIALAQALAGVAPETIGYIEAHGTGTPLGDPIEIAGLTQAFRAGTEARQFCAIGSVKTNIGHLDAAAGVAGLIKTALALKHRVLPASLHFTSPNPKLELEPSPFFVNAERREWTTDGSPRRAGVSSFGVGGTNAHVVLEEAPVASESSAGRPSQLIVLSAKSAGALESSTMQLRAALGGTGNLPVAHGSLPGESCAPAQPASDADSADSLSEECSRQVAANDGLAARSTQESATLADVAFTLRSGRHEFNHRRFVVASSLEDATAALADPKRIVSREQTRRDVPVAFMFPGQGAQRPGMGAGLYASEPVFRAAIDECSEILRPELGCDLREIIFSAAPDAAAQLPQTRFTQPALFVIGYALAQLWISRGIQPSAMIGHSVGEYVAATIAGVFSLADALRLVAARARLVQAQPAGAMVAVRLPEAEVKPLLDARLSIAAINSPNLCVISGPFEAIEILEALLRERGIAARRLQTSHAFHSAMMDPVLAPFTELLRQTTLRAPRVRFVSNLTADWITDAQATDPAYWAAHVRDAVRFADGVAVLFAAGPRALLECGPNPTLTQLARQHPAKTPEHDVIASLSDTGDENTAFVTALGKLWLAGVTIDWQALHAGEKRQRVSLPTYPFERQRFWAEPRKAPGNALVPSAGAGVPPERRSEHREPPESPSLREAATTTRDERSTQTSLLAEVLDTLQKLSGVDVAGIDPNTTFTELGFDSLFLTQASLALQKRFRVQITFRRLLEDVPSPAALAAWLGEKIPAPREEARTERGQPARVVAHLSDARTSRPRSEAHGPFRRIDTTAAPEFTPEQRAHLDALIAKYTRLTAKSKAFTSRNRPHLADPRAAAGFRRAWKEMVYPIVAERSAGSRIWDIDGNEYVDITLGFGQNLLGHRPPFVIDALEAQIHSGFEIGPTSPLAGEVAALMREFTGLDRVAFCNTGSEAVTAALRVARTVTGRSKIVLFAGSYHGIFDEVLVRPGAEGRAVPIAPGIEPSAMENVLVLDYGSDEALATIRAHAHELAAVLVEPVQSRRPDLQPRAFLHELRRITAESGTALVFDEIVTGFRCHPGGAQAVFGVKADIATYGKVVGGGLPIGIVCGAARFMDALDGGAWSYGDDSFPEAGVTFFAGTFVRHPLALASTRAVLLHLRSKGPQLQEVLNARTAQLVKELNAHFERRGVPLRWTHFSSMYFLAVPPELKNASLLWHHLRMRGIHAWESRPSFLSTTHTDADIIRIVEAFQESVDALVAADFLAPSSPVAVSAPREAAKITAPANAPLTEAQQELYFAAQLSSDASAAFNESITLHLRGPLDSARLRRAIEDVVARHEALRTVIAEDGAAQRISAESQIELPFIDLSALDTAALERERAAVLQAESCSPFDLARGPLLRARLIRRSREDHDLVLTVHHIVCDGWSFGVVANELARSYAGTSCGGAVQFREYAEWERAQRSPASEAYWLAQFREPPPALELPADRPRGGVRSYRGGRCSTSVPPELLDRLKRFSASQRATLFSTMLAGFHVLLHRLTGQGDIVVGIAAAGQAAMGAENLVGHCLNFLPIRSRIAGDTPFTEFVGTVKTLVLDAFDHQHFTFGTLLQKLALPRDASRMPLLGATFNIDRSATGLDFAHGLSAEFDINPKLRLGLELSFNLIETDRGTQLYCAFNRDLFEPATIERWLRHYLTLLDSIVADATRPLAALALLTEVERRRILGSWNDTAREYPAEQTVQGRFEEIATRHPEAIAVVDGSRRVTYRELDAVAERFANGLARHVVKPGDPIGVPAVPGVEFIAAVLGILKAGGSYVPLDPNEPPARLAQMREQCRAVVDLHATPSGAASARGTAPGASTAAYVIYTSGSTGVPKGVVVPHRAINRLVINTDYIHLGPDDAIGFASNLCFDATTFELWGALLNGARIVITPQEVLLTPEALAAHLAAHGITALFLTTAVFNRIAREAPATFRGLRTLLFGGEPADPQSVALVWRQGRPGRLVNIYGPTETTTFATAHPLSAEPSGVRIPIGRPIANTTAFILDRELQPVPIGVAGELHIGGPGVALGYLDSPELTAARFIETPHGRLYKTGDLARWLPDGTIDCLGRADEQIKLRGFRIEPGEVVNAVTAQAGVKDCVALLRDFAPGDRRLVAYFTPEGDATVSEEELRRAVKVLLPAYMVPSAFVAVRAFPLTANGKLDTRALPPPFNGRVAVNGAPTAPVNQAQSALLDIWRELLQRDSFGIRDDFFELGGHSLLVAEMIARFKERMGMAISFNEVQEHPTIESLAEVLMVRDAAQGAALPIVPVLEHGKGAPFHFFHGHLFGGPAFCRALAERFDGSRPFFAVNPHGIDGHLPPGTIEEMAESRLQSLRKIQPHGPYYLGGYCNGGYVAHEVARMLEAEGETVAALLLFGVDATNVNFRWVRGLTDFGGTLRGEDSERKRARYLGWRRRLSFLEYCAHPFALPDDLPPEQHVRHRCRKLKQLASQFVRALAAGPVAEPVDADPFTQIINAACYAYLPGSLRAKIVLLWPREQATYTPGDPSAEWRKVSRDVELRLVPGGHRTAITQPENVRAVGEEMRRVLDALNPVRSECFA